MKQIGTLLILSYLVLSCSGTKHLPKGEYLYVGTKQVKLEKVKYDDNWKIWQGGRKRSIVYYNLWDLPNGSLGFPFFRSLPSRLILYNWFYTEKEKGFSHWMQNNFGENPVTIRKIDPELKAEKVKNLYENWGHFGTTSQFSIRYRKRRPIATVYYQFLIPKAYTYRKIDYVVDSLQQSIYESFHLYRTSAILNSGDEFDLDKIKKEKSSLLNHFHNHGYYYFRNGDLTILADTTVGNKQLDLRIGFDTKLPATYFQKQTITNTTLTIDSVLQLSGSKYYDWPSGRIRQRVLDSLVQVSTGDLYSFDKVRTTVRNLSELGMFSNPLVSFSIDPLDSLKLNAKVSVGVLDATTIGLNAKANYKNVGYIGPSVGMNFSQLNVFGGAENLSVDLDAYYDFPIGVFRERISNSSGLSLNTSLSAPLIKPPFQFIKQTYSLPKKFITLRAELNDRKDYFNMVGWNASTGILWKSSPKVSHRLTILDATFSNIRNPTAKFDTLTVDNPALASSLIDQFILGSHYIFKYDNSSLETKRIGTYFEGKLELDGNILSLVSRTNPETGVKEPLGIPFSQMAQASYDFRTYLKLGEKSQLAFRNIGGLGIAYGNSNQLPYIRQFFIGGSNSLRPINARSAGPGRYLELDQNEVNQVGDLKLEWNLEYRIHLGLKLYGAIWADAGNIWLLKEDAARPFSGVRWNKIFQDSYLTTGLGLRFDTGFLILRADYGVVLYAPIFIEGYKWVWQNKLPLWGPVIGFGLPF
jgi:hypothetical protein